MYNVLYKGFSVGMTANLKEAFSWCNTEDHFIYRIKNS